MRFSRTPLPDTVHREACVIGKVRRHRTSPKPRVVVCVPTGITEVEQGAVRQATRQAGAKVAYLIEDISSTASMIGRSATPSRPPHRADRREEGVGRWR